MLKLIAWKKKKTTRYKFDAFEAFSGLTFIGNTFVGMKTKP